MDQTHKSVFDFVNSKIQSENLDQSPGDVALIHPNDIALPIAIISISDGIVVFATEEFKDIIPAAKVGEQIKGFLSSHEIRADVANKLTKREKVISVVEKQNYSLHFSLTKGKFAGTDHYIIGLEKKVKQSLADPCNQVNYLSREGFLKRLSDLPNQDHNADLCMCVIDIDRFKVVNEKYGFAAGDYVINEVVNLIAANIQDDAVVGRIGNNEFACVFHDMSIDDAVDRCESIRHIIKHEHFNYEHQHIALTVSIGVVEIKVGDELDNTLAQATLALSTAKESGRDCVHSSVVQDTMMAYHSGKMQYAIIIEDALQNDKFELFAQPIVCLDNPDSHYSYEVLLRMYDHVHQEYVSSQELISAAESLEVTTRIDQYVCEKVFICLQEKINQQTRIPKISINLSGHSIVSVAFERFLLDLTEKYKVPTSCIYFEITESVAVKSITRAQKFISNLKAVGYRFSLDDFGVGYCSFNYLNQLDVDNLKIDGSFVSAMLDNATQFATVQAITNVARTMNIKTIAEYVEKPEIIKALNVIGVDYGQGYLFGKPKPLSDIFR